MRFIMRCCEEGELVDRAFGVCGPSFDAAALASAEFSQDALPAQLLLKTAQ